MKVNWTDEQQQAMKRLYGQFVKAGDLAFNVGANIGTRTQTFVDLGAEVIAVEPQPDMADELRSKFWHLPVEVVQAAAGAKDGTVTLMLCTANPMATCATGWAELLQDRYPAEKWGGTIEVPQVSLDTLISRYGCPDFIKIDVEGYEREVLRGLTWQRVEGVRPIIGALCFEATIPYVEPAIECMEDLAGRLGFTEFNYIAQEHMKLVLSEWVDADGMEAILRRLPARTLTCDVFAR